MNFSPNRRQMLKTTGLGGAAITLGQLGILGTLPPVSAEEASPKPDIVRLRPEIEPIVRLIEDTPRDRLLEEVATRIKSGKLRYQQVLAALLLAGVRNVQPRPAVGFKFHAVLVVNSA
ncbi:MAG: twin-arginine translocation signal domain-containing protein, partial [Akkermansiaceae bacterium]